MTDREKLLDILMDNLPDDNPWEGAVKTLLDHLLANGVVVREKGEWELYPSSEYRRCRVCKTEYEKARFNVRANFCPNCGADMRKGENG